jgi:hypothetical protein
MEVLPDSSRAGSARSRPWYFGDRYLLRIAALPVESLAGLRCVRSIDWADAVIEERERLRLAGARLADELHQHIGQAEGANRSEVIAARRQIFNNMPLKDPAVLRGVTGGLGERLGDWMRDRHALDVMLAAGSEVVAADLCRSREVLRQLAAESLVRHGLLLASPTLDAYLDGYRTAVPLTLTKRQRRIERSLLEYLHRIVYKTSPFSTFTAVVLGEFGDGDGAVPYAGRLGPHWLSRPRLNVALLGRLADLIVDNEKLRADLPVHLTPGWQSELDRIRYVRRSVNHNDDIATGIDVMQADVYYLSRSPSLVRTLELLEREPVLGFGEFVNRVGAAEQASDADCRQWADVLCRLGLVEVAGPRPDIHHADPVRGFADNLRGLRLPWADDIADRLDAIARRVDAYAVADLPERRAILTWVREQLTAMFLTLGPRDIALPRSILYEDVRFTAEPVVTSSAHWAERIGGALATVCSVLPIFDMLRPEQLLLKAFFLIRYGRGGRCDDVLRFVHEFKVDIYDQFTETADNQQRFDEHGAFLGMNNWLNSPEVAALERARQRFADHVRQALAALPAGAHELCLDDAFMTSMAEALAPVAPTFAAQSHFVQMARTPAGPLVVMNRSFGGVSFPFSRFTHCFSAQAGSDGPDLATTLRADNRARQPNEAVFVEFVGGVLTTNLNLHGRLTDYQLVCPGETSPVPESDQIAMGDLYLTHDEASDELTLRSRRLGRRVIPVYLGYLVPLMLPAIARVLILLSPAMMAPLRPWAGVPVSEGRGGVRTRPRLRYRTVVLSRRSWAVPSDRLPQRRPGTSDAAWLLSWRTWQREHGLPDEVFAAAGTPVRFGSAKPHHVDFRSYHSLTALEHLAGAADGEVRFEEMLPAEDDLYVTSGRGRHVTEMAVEVTTCRMAPA